jgi:hypothetical protein
VKQSKRSSSPFFEPLGVVLTNSYFSTAFVLPFFAGSAAAAGAGDSFAAWACAADAMPPRFVAKYRKPNIRAGYLIDKLQSLETAPFINPWGRELSGNTGVNSGKCRDLSALTCSGTDTAGVIPCTPSSIHLFEIR